MEAKKRTENTHGSTIKKASGKKKEQSATQGISRFFQMNFQLKTDPEITHKNDSKRVDMVPIPMPEKKKEPKEKKDVKLRAQLEAVRIELEDIHVQNQQLRARREEMKTQLQVYQQMVEQTKEMLLQLLDVEVALNGKMAMHVIQEAEWGAKETWRQLPVNEMANALRKIRYYYHPSLEEWVREVEKAKREKAYHEQLAVELAKENERLKDQATRLEEEKAQMIRARLEASAGKVSARGMRLVVNEKRSEAAVEPIAEKPVSLSDEEKRRTEQAQGAETAMPMRSYEGAEKREPSVVETVTEEEKEICDVLQKPKYLHLLDKKGYAYKKSENPRFDVVIEKGTKEIPLMYIDYTVQKTDIFDGLLDKTDHIFFLFDNKENMKKGNIKFTAWFLKTRKKKPDLHLEFSFTTVDELNVKGLDELNSL